MASGIDPVTFASFNGGSGQRIDGGENRVWDSQERVPPMDVPPPEGLAFGEVSFGQPTISFAGVGQKVGPRSQ